MTNRSRRNPYATLAFPVLGLTLALSLGACGGSDNNSVESNTVNDPVLRGTRYGAVRGLDQSTTSGIYAWLGIPYAKPPVGNLRWRAPAEPESWQGIRVTTDFGNACVQAGNLVGPGANNRYDGSVSGTLGQVVGSEDCLYLNIWRPSTKEADLPVLVFIHGGSLTSGYTADPTYNGGNLAKTANAVVVTINYRLGPLGFLNLPQLKTGVNVEEASGNFGILDNVQALKFVRDNIASFGGNSKNVTVMGESAGGILTWSMVASPLAKGLLHRAIPISGGLAISENLPQGAVPAVRSAAITGAQDQGVLARLVIGDGKATDQVSATAFLATQTDQQIVSYLRSKDPTALLRAFAASGAGGSPTPDGVVLPINPVEEIKKGNFNNVPVMAGNTGEEGKGLSSALALLGLPAGIKVGDAELFNILAKSNPDVPTVTEADIISPVYLPIEKPQTGWNTVTGVITQQFFLNHQVMLSAVATQQPNTYWYSFNWAQNPGAWRNIFGAAHAFDLPFEFGNFSSNVYSNAISNSANAGGRLGLSDAMMRSIGAFMRSGNPNNPSLGTSWPVWPSQLQYDATLTEKKISVK